MALGRTGTRAVQRMVDKRINLVHGNISGAWFPSWSQVPKGQLPENYGAEPGRVYVIFSYDTPIAWVAAERGGFMQPDIKYSVTTTNHQKVVRAAIKGHHSR